MKYQIHKSSKRTTGILLLMIACTLLTGKAHAGAWPVRKGKLLLSPSFSYFNASRLWDKNGKASNYADSGYFKSIGVYLYSEYGASRRITIVTSIPFVSNTFKNNTYKSTATGFSDAELGARLYLFNINFKFYFAIQGTAVIPLYMNTTDKSMGYGVFGSDLKIVGSGSAKLGGESSLYYTVELGGRGYFANDGPLQYKGNASLGINIDKQNQISFAASATKSQSVNKTFTGDLTQNKDFEYLQASLSVGHSFSTNFSIFANYNQFVLGRNTGIGTNISLSFISRF